MNINHTIRQWALDESFLYGRMSFICGPRQIGKTTLVQNYLERIKQSENYHNWDSLSLRQQFASNSFFFIEKMSLPLSREKRPPVRERQWVAFDEIHKYPRWKNILKGYYDELKNSISFVITGSARLDYLRRSGDRYIMLSQAGRQGHFYCWSGPLFTGFTLMFAYLSNNLEKGEITPKFSKTTYCLLKIMSPTHTILGSGLVFCI